MNKDEAINLIIEEAKRGNEYAHTDFCEKYVTCKECPLGENEGCRKSLFNSLIERLLKAEEKKETNFDHYIVRNGVHITKEPDVEIWEFRFKKGTEKQFFDANIKSVLDWLLSPYEPPKPKYKLSKFEYDLLRVYLEEVHIGCIRTYWELEGMCGKGYFKDLPTNIPFKDILDNCEVIDGEQKQN